MSWRSALALAGALATSASGLAVLECNPGSGQPSHPACASGSTCVADPVSHCVREAGCSSSIDCRAGLECGFRDIAVDGSCHPDGGCVIDVTQQCTVQTQASFDPDVLPRSFGVPPFQATLQVTGSLAQVTWTPPTGATRVACTLYSCLPEVRFVDGDVTIANYEQCARKRTVVNASQSAVFDLGVPPAPINTVCVTIGEYPANSCRPPEDARPGPVVLSVVSAACLAYSDTAMVGATQLIQVDPSQTQLAESMSSCASAGPFGSLPCGSNCALDDSGALGWCAEGACRVRCSTNQDCNPADASRFGDDAGLGQPLQTCVAADGVGFGVCVPEGGR